MKKCENCQQEFEITENDRKYYGKIDVPEPTLCPDCRDQKRLMFRNERNLYKRKCDLCKKEIISVYSEDKTCPVYCQECWWGDKWAGTKYGRDFDFDKPFFEQFAELVNVTPKLCITNIKNYNSPYIWGVESKSCYLCFSCIKCEDCQYSSRIIGSKNCFDCHNCYESELCYQSQNIRNCYSCLYCIDSENCSDIIFGYDLKGCKNCIGCTGLRNKTYYILNKPVPKEEFEKFQDFGGIKRKFEDLKLKTPRKNLQIINCENCIGDEIRNSKNCTECFEIKDSWDCKYMKMSGDMKDSMDISFADGSELIYEIHSDERNNNVKFSNCAWFCQNAEYCDLINSTHDVFGCASLNHKSYCILNKQYTKEEYEKLLPRVKGHMRAPASAGGGKKTGEYGQFFPVELSLFAYNETVAMIYFPLTKEQVLERGLKWKDEDKKEYKPAHGEILVCDKCGKNYKINDSEKEFYKKFNLKTPEFCPDCRHKERMNDRNPHKIQQRKCANCKTEMLTTYSQERPEVVFCEKCYLQVIN